MKYLLISIAFLCAASSFGQNLNWSTIPETQKSIAYFNFGYDFGATLQAGYGYQVKTFKPTLLTFDYSMPMGEKIADDFKLRLGAQLPILKKNHFILSGKLYSNFRRHETSMVSMVSFGSELAAVAGYYKSTWHIAGEFGFDKAITTQVVHSERMKEYYPSIKDGWITPTGGQFFFGIQGSKTLGEKLELSLRIGGTNAQSTDENALLPYYGQVGLIYKILPKKKELSQNIPSSRGVYKIHLDNFNKQGITVEPR